MESFRPPTRDAHSRHELCSRRRKEADFHPCLFSASLRRRLWPRLTERAIRPGRFIGIFFASSLGFVSDFEFRISDFSVRV
jgi:hypothetical protein